MIAQSESTAPTRHPLTLGRFSTLLPLLLLIALGWGCASSKGAFLHVGHRLNYGIEDDEIRNLQFFISSEILAHDLTRGASPSERVVVLPDETAGIVVDLGESWIRVSFEEGGSGAVFLTDPHKRDDGYWLATELENGAGYRKLTDFEKPILRQAGSEYRLIVGADAFLIVENDAIEKLLSQRRHLEGHRK